MGAYNIREIILDTLLELERGKEYSHLFIKAVMDKYDYLEDRDKAFFKRVTEGTIERKIELDYILNQYSKVRVEKMKPLIRCLLRMSVYQILYMDQIPDSAVCNEAVKLVSKRRFHNLKGFVNGVLRNISKHKEALPYPDEQKEPLLFLSVKYSMPDWIVEMWLNQYGKDTTIKMLEELLRIHPVSVRFSSFVSEEERDIIIKSIENAGGMVENSPYHKDVVLLTRLSGISTLTGYLEGAFVVQDVSSVLCVEAAGIQKDHVVMDICAAPGGKSILASEKANHVIARDISDFKLERILDNSKRLKVKNMEVLRWDATIYDEDKKHMADVLLADVPCSGLGVIGKKRDLKYNVSKEKIESIVTLQKEILRSSWQYVKPGGILLYSTCTIHPAENEEICRWICSEFPFEPEDMTDCLPDWLLEQNGINSTSCVQILPGVLEMDGFFFAKMRRKAE